MGSSPPDPVLSGAPACGPPAPLASPPRVPGAPPPLAPAAPSFLAPSPPAAACRQPHLSPMGSVHYPRRPPSGWFLHLRAVVVPSGGTVQPFVHRSGGPPLSPSIGPNFRECPKGEVRRIPIPRT